MRKKICLKENQKDECVGKKMVPLCLQEEELLSEKVQGFLVPLKERKASKREREICNKIYWRKYLELISTFG